MSAFRLFHALLFYITTALFLHGCVTVNGKPVNLTGLVPVSDKQATTSTVERGVEVVSVVGYGENETEARRDAVSKAVAQVVGQYVVSDVIIEHDEIIKDQIISQSRGFVTDFVAKDRGIGEDGIYFIDCLVTVESSRISKRLGELNIGLKELGTDRHKAASESIYQTKTDFRSVVAATMYEPLAAGQDVYHSDIIQIKLDSLSSLDGKWITWIQRSGQASDQQSAELGELLPVLIRFRFGFNQQHLGNLLGMLEKTSERQQVYASSSAGGEFGEIFGELVKSVVSIPESLVLGLVNPSGSGSNKMVSVYILQPYLESEYNKHRSTWNHKLKEKPTKRYYYHPDKAQIMNALHNSFLEAYSPILSLRFLSDHGDDIGGVTYKAGRIDSSSKRNYYKSLSALSSLQMESDFVSIFTRETQYFEINSNSERMLTGLDKTFQKIHETNNIFRTYVFMNRDQFVKLKDIKIDLVWVRK